MSKKLEKNGLWESSRMMLPEHREAIVGQNRSLMKREKPDLDEQGQEEIVRAIGLSMLLSKPITFVLFDEYEERDITGIATKINKENGTVKICGAGGEEWIRFTDIICARQIF